MGILGLSKKRFIENNESVKNIVKKFFFDRTIFLTGSFFVSTLPNSGKFPPDNIIKLELLSVRIYSMLYVVFKIV